MEPQYLNRKHTLGHPTMPKEAPNPAASAPFTDPETIKELP